MDEKKITVFDISYEKSKFFKDDSCRRKGKYAWAIADFNLETFCLEEPSKAKFKKKGECCEFRDRSPIVPKMYVFGFLVPWIPIIDVSASSSALLALPEETFILEIELNNDC